MTAIKDIENACGFNMKGVSHGWIYYKRMIRPFILQKPSTDKKSM